MLQITVPAREAWDEINQQFINTKETTIRLEHSLVSVSKWETEWCVPFLNKRDMTVEQIRDYVRCMTVTQNVDPNVYLNLTEKNLKEVFDYIASKKTATFFSDKEKGGRRRIITSELIYCWMVMWRIPFQCEKWPLDRLITLIRVCEAENKQPKQGSRRSAIQRNAEIKARNRARRNRG